MPDKFENKIIEKIGNHNQIFYCERLLVFVEFDIIENRNQVCGTFAEDD